MRILYIYCHPLPESFHAAIREKALAALAEAGHEVDLLDLYAEKFDPVLSEDARRHYHDPSCNRIGLERYIARLTSADALVLQFRRGASGRRPCSKAFSTA
jgi:NAD(P)H dehydrogenase (quinone)